MEEMRNQILKDTNPNRNALTETKEDLEKMVGVEAL
jgi:hypothetical protein